MSEPRNVVIVGAGLAATRTVEELRRLGVAAAITVVGAEKWAPYDRPPLSKDVLRGELDVSLLREDWSELDVEMRLGRRALGVRPSAQTVLLDDGVEVGYDALVIASGARPKRLPSVSGAGVHVLRTVDDAHALRADVRERGRLTIVGGGFIGCEAAANARRMGADVCLIELLETPLARVLGTQVGAEIAELHEREGVELRCGVAVQAARGQDSERELLLSDGALVRSDVVLIALGVRPDTDWLATSGIELDGDGVLCDARGRTSAPNVWAAGDCASWLVPSLGERHRHEHWTSAADQGTAVARDIAGEGAALEAVPYFWSDQYSTKFQMLGAPAADDDVTILRVGPAADRLLAVYARSGRLTGVLGANAPKWVMRLRPLIARGADLTEALDLARS
jgi:3-phenylpropionate/trans-cinnamate dioxygenase ferredoxin reductase subunit